MNKAMRLPAAIAITALLGFGSAFADSKVVAKVGELEITTQELAFAESELSREFAQVPAESARPPSSLR